MGFNHFLAALIFALFAPFLIAEDPEDRLTAVLAALRATDSKEQNLFCKGRCHLAKFSHRLTSMEIESLGARTLLDVLAAFPGLVVTKDARGRTAIGMYGMLGDQRLQILIDGIRHNDPFDGSAMLSMPAHVIDFIDVYFGPGGTWFGEGSLSGVIDVNIKKLPEIRQFLYAATNQSLGAGLFAVAKRNQFKVGVSGAFSVIHPNDPTTLINAPDEVSVKSLWAQSFLDARVSNSAQAHVVFKTGVTREWIDEIALPKSPVARNRLAVYADLHLLKKRAQKNAMDLFFTTSFFRGNNHLDFYVPQQAHPNHLSDTYNALRLELGTRFHMKPWNDHDLFFGIGATIEGVTSGEHKIEQDDTSTTDPFNFVERAHIFGRPSALFQSARGHAYGFIQDEWQIKAPFLVVLGTRVMLPIESPNFSAEFTPNIGAVLTPFSKVRIKLAFHTSLRTPTPYELSDRLFDAKAADVKPFTPHHLAFEKADSIEASIWYGEQLGTMQIKNSLSAHFSEVDDAIIYRTKTPLSNRNELNIFGVRLMSEASFDGGHSFALGVFYSLAYRRDFDEAGYPTCRAGFLNPFSSKPMCPIEDAVPRIVARASLMLDLLSIGSVTLGSSFVGQSQIEDLFRDPYTVFHITYQTKPLWRYLVGYLSLRGFVGGMPFVEKRLDHALPRQSFQGGTVLSGGVHVTL